VDRTRLVARESCHSRQLDFRSDSCPCSATARSHVNLSPGVCAGIGVGAFVGVIVAVAAAWFFLHHRRRRRLRPQYDGPIMTQGKPDADTHIPLPSPFVSSPVDGLRGSRTHSAALVYEPYLSSPSTSDRKEARLV